jgi:hypothetical protein
MSITVLLNDDSEKISCALVMDILFGLCLFNVDFSCQAYNFGHREEKLLLHLSILFCFNSNIVVKQLFVQFFRSTFEMLIRHSPQRKVSFTLFQFFAEA